MTFIEVFFIEILGFLSTFAQELISGRSIKETITEPQTKAQTENKDQVLTAVSPQTLTVIAEENPFIEEAEKAIEEVKILPKKLRTQKAA